MKTLTYYGLYLLCTFNIASVHAEHNLLWSKLEISADLPAPYGKTSVAFLTSVHNDTRLVSQVNMSNPTGHWAFTHPEIHLIPIEILTYKAVIPIKKNCAEFKQNCISFGWSGGEPQYITSIDGSIQSYFQRVTLKITEKGEFDFQVKDTYKEAVELELKYREFLKSYKEDFTETQEKDVQKVISFTSMPNISFPNYYYGNRAFYYEIPEWLGTLGINIRYVNKTIAGYKLLLSSDNVVDVTKAIKAQGLHFSRFSSPLVFVNKEKNTVMVKIACLLNDPADHTSYTAARFSITENGIVSIEFVKQKTQNRSCELED